MFPIRDHNPSGKTPIVTWTLIAINVLIYVAMLGIPANSPQLSNFYGEFALIPAFITNGFGWSGLITSMFLHGGLLHLAGNMLFLFIFADNIEDEMGHGWFLLFYLASGVLAGLAHVIADPVSQVPLVGASGAIAGVMGAYLLMFPRAKVDILLILIVFIRVISLPAWIVLAIWFGLQLLSGASDPGSAGGVAYWAHAGGFIVGIGLALPLWLKNGGPRFWQRTHGHPPHPHVAMRYERTNVPKVRKR